MNLSASHSYFVYERMSACEFVPKDIANRHAVIIFIYSEASYRFYWMFNVIWYFKERFLNPAPTPPWEKSILKRINSKN